MTVFSTCRGCMARTDCSKQRELRKFIKGSNVSLVRHRCADRCPEFQPGDAVFVKTGVPVDDQEKGWINGEYPAVFIRETVGTSIICFIRPGTPSTDQGSEFFPRGESKGFVKVSRSRVRMRVAASTDLGTCPECGEHLALTGECKDGCARRAAA
jgi:hypothetical protein